MTESKKTGELRVSFMRRQWLKALAILQDYPKTSIGLVAIILGLQLFYATQLNGLAHFAESLSRWRVQNFGGEHVVDRASRVPDVILSFPKWSYDRLDAVSLTSVHFGGRAFRAELKELVDRNGRIRVLGLDPRMGESEHPNHATFTRLAEAFGEETFEFRSRCWHSTAVLLWLHRQLSDGFEVRLIDEALPGAEAPYLSPGRWSHAYRGQTPDKRMDVIIERPATPDGTDSFTHRARVFRNRPNDPTVTRFTSYFESAWSSAIPVDQALEDALLALLNGTQAR